MKLIETQIDIRAEAQTVWSILTDFPAYPLWNPLLTTIEGELAHGARLRVCVTHDGRSLCFRPRIVSLWPGRELVWKGRWLMPGMFDGKHAFRLTPTGTGVRLTQAERFTGIAASLLGPSQLDTLRSRFEAMNDALRQRAEATAALRAA